MANGKIRFGKQSGGELTLVIPDGADNTEVTFPESGELATKEYIANTAVKLTGNQTIAGVKTFSSNIVGNITGNSGSATKLQTERTITLSGDVSGSTSFDGSGNVTLAATVANDSHTHAFANLTSKPTTLQGYDIIPEEIPTSIDLGTRTKTGLYSQSSNSEATLALNYPIATAGLLEVFAYSNIIHQRYWVYNSSHTFYRAKYNTGPWTSWTKGANVDDNVATATKLQTARTINGVSFDGSANITVSDSTAVKLTGNQTIAGVKTFTSSPVVPTPTTNFQVATKKYVDDNAETAWVSNDTRAKTALNASGTAPIYACRAWVNFDGTGTVAIRASGNVSSITDNGTGNYTVNFTTAMPDNQYAVGAQASALVSVGQANEIGIVSMSTTSVQFRNLGDGNQAVDREYNKLTIFR